MKLLLESDNGHEIAVALGEIIELRLPEVSGTGFSWVFISDGAPGLALEKEFPAESKPTPGAQRMREWRFKVMATGDSTLELEYKRPWEKGAPARRFLVKLRAGSRCD